MRNGECGIELGGRSPSDASIDIPHSAFAIPHWGGAVIDLSGQRAFVTGGGRGIGRATAVLLARAGCAVAAGYRRRRQDAEATVSAVDGRQAPPKARAVAGGLGHPA